MGSTSTVGEVAFYLTADADTLGYTDRTRSYIKARPTLSYLERVLDPEPYQRWMDLES